MSFLAWVVVGIVAGFLAKNILGKAPGGVRGDMIIGVVGAVIGGWIMNAFGTAGATGINVWSIFVAFLGANVFLFILRMATRRERAS